MKVANPKTGRAILVRAEPTSTFRRVWREPEVRRQLIARYGNALLRQLERLGIAPHATPVVFTFLPDGSFGVDNDFLTMPMDRVRVVHAAAHTWRQTARSLDRSQLLETNQACLLDPAHLKYPVCDASGALDCRGLLAARDRGRLLGTRESNAIANTAAALHTRFCS